MDPSELKAKLDAREDLFLLDVREPDECTDWHLPGSVNIPLAQLPSRLSDLPKGKPVVTICAHGIRSARATQFLTSRGYRVSTLEGGMVAWNSVMDTAEQVDGDVRVLQFRRVGKGCLSYMLFSGQEAAVIDPSADPQPYLNSASSRAAKIVLVLDTHTHADHVSSGQALASLAKCRYWSPDLRVPVTDRTSPLSFGSQTLQALPTPGHTPESVTFLLGSLAFTGDTLFTNSVGRPDLGQDSGKNAPLLWHSVQRLLALAPSTRILPAHYEQQNSLPKIVLAATSHKPAASLPSSSPKNSSSAGSPSTRALPR